MKQSKAAALAYAARGWHIVPILPGKKAPSCNDWTARASTDPDLIAQWYDTHTNHGVGIATGQASGIFVLDVDTGPGKDGEETLAELQHQHGKLPDTLESLTGSGGRHIFFNWPDGQDIRNSASGILGMGLDIRGNGGQVVAAPTIHPNGTAYQWEGGEDPRTAHIADAPQWLLDKLTQPVGDHKPRHVKAANAGTRPGDRWANDTPWADLLETDGAKLVRAHDTQTQGYYELWSRPPMIDEHGFEPHPSASLFYKGSDSLKVFSSNWQVVNRETGEIVTLQAEQAYSKFWYYVTTRHGGNTAAATKAIVKMGYGDQRQTPANTARNTIEGGPLDDNAFITDDTVEIVPLPQDAKPPEFPYWVLPDVVNDYLDNWAGSTCLSREMATNCFVGAFSAVMNHRGHQVKTSNRTQRMNMFILICAKSGQGKSPAFNACMDPVNKMSKALTDASKAVATANRARIDTLKIERDKAAQDLKQTSKTNARYEQVQILYEEAAIALDEAQQNLRAEPYRMHATGNVTPEAFTYWLSSNYGHTMSLLSDEGGFFDSIDRYSSGGSGDLDGILGAFNGGDPTALRKTVGATVDFEHGAYSTFMFGVQPGVVDKLYANAVFVDRGLASRFVVVHPPAIHMQRVAATEPNSLFKNAFDIWMERFCEPTFTSGTTYYVTGETEHLYKVWADAEDERIRDDESARVPGVDVVRGCWAKMQEVAIRLAGMLHVMHERPGVEVEFDTMHAAMAVVDYYMEYTRQKSGTTFVNQHEQMGADVLEWAARQPDGRFSARDLFRKGPLRGSCVNMDQVRDFIGEMIEWGWLETDRPLDWREGGRGVGGARFWEHPNVTDSGRFELSQGACDNFVTTCDNLPQSGRITEETSGEWHKASKLSQLSRCHKGDFEKTKTIDFNGFSKTGNSDSQKDPEIVGQCDNLQTDQNTSTQSDQSQPVENPSKPADEYHEITGARVDDYDPFAD